jgi:hypothetical protein
MANAWKEMLSLAMMLVARGGPEFGLRLKVLVSHYIAICSLSVRRESSGCG